MLKMNRHEPKFEKFPKFNKKNKRKLFRHIKLFLNASIKFSGDFGKFDQEIALSKKLFLAISNIKFIKVLDYIIVNMY
jgi:hypothetical protein